LINVLSFIIQYTDIIKIISQPIVYQPIKLKKEIKKETATAEV